MAAIVISKRCHAAITLERFRKEAKQMSLRQQQSKSPQALHWRHDEIALRDAPHMVNGPVPSTKDIPSRFLTTEMGIKHGVLHVPHFSGIFYRRMRARHKGSHQEHPAVGGAVRLAPQQIFGDLDSSTGATAVALDSENALLNRCRIDIYFTSSLYRIVPWTY